MCELVVCIEIVLTRREAKCVVFSPRWGQCFQLNVMFSLCQWQVGCFCTVLVAAWTWKAVNQILWAMVSRAGKGVGYGQIVCTFDFTFVTSHINTKTFWCKTVFLSWLMFWAVCLKHSATLILLLLSKPPSRFTHSIFPNSVFKAVFISWCVCLCVASVTVKHSALYVVDGRCRSPLAYYHYSIFICLHAVCKHLDNLSYIQLHHLCSVVNKAGKHTHTLYHPPYSRGQTKRTLYGF